MNVSKVKKRWKNNTFIIRFYFDFPKEECKETRMIHEITMQQKICEEL